MKKIITFSYLIFYITTSQALTYEQWESDIEQLVNLIETHHPNPYGDVNKEDFYKLKAKLKNQLPNFTDDEIMVGMMKLTSTLKDGHTSLFPSNKSGFDRWFPLSFYRFSDGVYIVAGDRKYKKLMAKRIKKIGSVEAEHAHKLTADLLSFDNKFGQLWNTFYLSSANSLQVLGVINDLEKVKITVIDVNGKEYTETVESIKKPFNLEHRFWGEMYPVGTKKGNDYIIAYDGLELDKYRMSSKNGLMKQYPLFFQSRRAYWYQYSAENKAIYLHMTHVTDQGRGEYESFEQFYDNLFEYVENNDVEKFILDTRFCSGGDGSVLIPFVHKFIRSDKINQKGKLFTLTGRKTFSACVMLLDLMLKHTETLIVGEPAGAPRNSYGDPMTFYLQHSGMQLSLSAVYWQLTHSLDISEYEKVHIPAVFSGKQYFNGVDPAVDLIMGLDKPYQTLPDLLIHQGGDIAEKEYHNRKSQYGNFTWWKAFEENLMRYAARNLYAQGKKDDGLIGFKMLTEQYPNSWRAWRDFGRAYLTDGNHEKAIECFSKGLTINPGYEYFSDQIKLLSTQ